MTEPLPPPLVPAEVDLRDFPFTPLVRAQLFGSSFHARSTDGEWRAGVTLWLKSWDQVPAGTLPDDDIDLCRLAELGRDVKTWAKIKPGAMRGWTKCSDGRLHHAVVAEGVLQAWERRTTAKKKGMAGASKRWTDKDGRTDAPAIPKDAPANAPAIAVAMPGDSKGQGEGQGQGEEGSASLRSAGADAPHDDEAKKTYPDIQTELWREGLPILKALTGKGDAPCRKVLGSMLDAIGKDHAQLLSILRAAGRQRPDEPIAWIRAAINQRTGLLSLAPDPYGIAAWTARQLDVGKGTNRDTGALEPAINGNLIGVTAELIAQAVGLPESWRGNWDAMGDWMRDDLLIDDRVLHAMGEQARRMGEEPRSMKLFDGLVRSVAERALA